MIIEIEEGKQVGPLAPKEWVSAHEVHLRFGSRCMAAKQDKCTKLLYAMQEVLSKGEGPLPILNGYEHKLELVDPEAKPRKCKTRRYSPVEHAGHPGGVRQDVGE